MSKFGRTKHINMVSKSATSQAQFVFFANDVNTRTRLFMLGTLVIAALCSATFNTQAAQLSQPSNDLETRDIYQFFEAQISQSEIREASDALEQLILDIEESQGRYAPELIQPLSILGKAQMATQDYMQAAETFDRAVHLTRINFGLFESKQVTLVYLQADSFAAMGDFRNAQQREEYAFQVLSNRSSRRKLLTGMLRLGDFYLETYNFLAARTLFRQGYEVLQTSSFSDSESAIPFLKGTASSYRMERFPPLYSQERRIDELGRKPENTRTLDYSNEYLTINNFPAGERALQKIVKIRQSALSFRDENPDPEVIQKDQALLNQALLDLGDWHLLFSRQKKAHTLYKEIHRQQAELPTELKIDLDTPHLLYFPAPQNLKPPPVQDRLDAETGSITLAFSVYENGRIRGLETIAFEPNDAIEFNARRSMRQAVYRPAMIEGEVMVTPAHRYVHTYQYFPSRKAQAHERRELEQQRLNNQGAELEGKEQADQQTNHDNAEQTSEANAA